jgi:hypothetical protein
VFLKPAVHAVRDFHHGNAIQPDGASKTRPRQTNSLDLRFSPGNCIGPTTNAMVSNTTADGHSALPLPVVMRLPTSFQVDVL